MTSNFERKFGKYAIKNLTLYLIIAYVVGYVIGLMNPEICQMLTFDPYMIFKGQIWRIVTWILMPPEELGIFTIIMLILYYQLGQSLEKTWGTYRYNVYMFSGLIFTVIGAVVLYVVLCAYYGATWEGAISSQLIGNNIGYYVSTYYINMSIFLAFAATYPNMQLLLYFIIPIKVKWFGILYSALIAFECFTAFREAAQIGIYLNAIIITVLIVVSLLNFIIYFFSTRKHGVVQHKRKHEYRQSIKRATVNNYENGARHKCAVCGRTELDDSELTFRYCSKCSGNKEYCQEHLFTHAHN